MFILIQKHLCCVKKRLRKVRTISYHLVPVAKLNIYWVLVYNFKIKTLLHFAVSAQYQQILFDKVCFVQGWFKIFGKFF